jgi:hypothetical protein
VAENVSVPPRSEMVVEGRVNDHISDHSQIGIIEQTDEFIITEKGPLSIDVLSFP